MNIAKQILKTGRELISDPGQWAQGYSACDAYGQPVSVCSDRAKSWCSLGALEKAAEILGADDETCKEAFELLRQQIPGYFKVVSIFNDRSTHADVLALWGRAIAG